MQDKIRPTIYSRFHFNIEGSIEGKLIDHQKNTYSAVEIIMLIGR